MYKGFRILAVVAVVALLATVLATVVLAQGPRGGSVAGTDEAWSGCSMGGAGYGRGAFVDEDGDGVCDTFVDEDGDGVCDTAGENCPMGGAGFRRGGGRGGMRGGCVGASSGCPYLGTETSES
jgi:hypothetical protein